MSRRLLALILLVLLAGGCARARGDRTGPDPASPSTVAQDPPSSAPPSSAAPDVATIPAVIDEAYLNRVLAALDAVDGEATRIIRAKKDFAPEAAELLIAIYDQREFNDQTDVWVTDLETDAELRSIKPNPGNRRTTVHRIISWFPTCVWMAVLRDYSETATSPPEPKVEYIVLHPLDKSRDPKGHNPTAWMIANEGYNADGSEPPDQCAGR